MKLQAIKSWTVGVNSLIPGMNHEVFLSRLREAMRQHNLRPATAEETRTIEIPGRSILISLDGDTPFMAIEEFTKGKPNEIKMDSYQIDGEYQWFAVASVIDDKKVSKVST